MEQSTFESDIDRLAALQDVDRRIKEKQETVDTLRIEMEDWSAQLMQHRDDVTRLIAERDSLASQRRDLEGKLEIESERVKGSRMRMERARNEREMLACKHEINISKEGSQVLEEQLMSIFERMDAVAGQLLAAQEKLAGLEGVSSQEVDTRQGRVEELVRDISAEKEMRTNVVLGMNVSLRSRYEQIFTRRGGSAVVIVKHGTCQGCYVSVPPQLFNELKKFRDIRQCPNCHRILYWKPEIDTATAV